MKDSSSERVVLTVMESMFKAGLRSIREQLSLIGRDETEIPQKIKKSNTNLVACILREAGHPLHIDEVIRIARESKGVELHRESIVSALTKKVIEGKTFFRSGRNEFSLLEWKGK